MDYKSYEPIAVEGLPAAYPLIFNQLQLTFTPPNDGNIVRTITGKSLQLVTARTTKNGPESVGARANTVSTGVTPTWKTTPANAAP